MTEKIDDKKVIHPRRRHKYFWPIVIGILFILFFTITSFYYFFQLRKSDDAIIAQHIEQLSQIFNKINIQSTIMKIEGDRNTIDFLNIKSFAGNHAGPLILEYPDKWQGPYLIKDLKIQNKPYQILRIKKSYYIVPSDGVKLQNGNVIGKDLILNANNTDIEKLLNDTNGLMGKNGKPLAAKVAITNDPFDLMVSRDPFAFSSESD